MMKPQIYLVILMCIISLLIGCKPINQTALYGEIFDQGVALADGSFAPVNHWEDQWRIVNIWAKWCQPCWQEIPELNQYHTQQEPNVKLLGYNFDELSQEELQPLTLEMSIQFPILVSWPDAWRYPEIKGLPATVIIAPNNTLVSLLLGPQTLEGLKHALDSAKNEYKQ